MPIPIQALKDAVTKAQRALDNWEVDPDSREVVDMYESLLDEPGDVVIGGLSYSLSYALKKMDTIAYDTGMVNFADSLDKEEFDEYRELVEKLGDAKAALDAALDAAPTMPILVNHAHGTAQHFQDWFDAYTALAVTYGQSIYVVDAHGWELGAYSTPDLSIGKAWVWSCEKESLDDAGYRSVATISSNLAPQKA